MLEDDFGARGVAKEDASIDHWLKGLAPSTELRKWFGHDPDTWPESQNRYLEELKQAEAEEDLQAFMTLLEDHKRITVVFAAKDTEHNDAVELRGFLLTNRLP